MADSGDADAAGQETTQSLMEVSSFANYLRRVVPVLLEDVEDTPVGLVTTLKDKSSVDLMKKFIGDPQLPVLLIQRLTTKGRSVLNSVYHKSI